MPCVASNSSVEVLVPLGGCQIAPDWKDCNTCGGDFDGYVKSDGFVQLCVNNTLYLCRSTTTIPNKDKPFEGAFKQPPTWEINSLGGWLSKLLGA